VFEKFFRGKVSSPGAGLGLAISRGVVEVHGGTLTTSRAPGGGARFTLTLPLVGQPPPPVPKEQLAEVQS
jgi:two-component system NtrC family sensor kinase